MSQTIRERKALLLNNAWSYTTAEDSRKPGYLSRKFAKIKAELKRDKAETERVVKPLIRGKA